MQCNRRICHLLTQRPLQMICQSWRHLSVLLFENPEWIECYEAQPPTTLDGSAQGTQSHTHLHHKLVILFEMLFQATSRTWRLTSSSGDLDFDNLEEFQNDSLSLTECSSLLYRSRYITRGDPLRYNCWHNFDNLHWNKRREGGSWWFPNSSCPKYNTGKTDLSTVSTLRNPKQDNATIHRLIHHLIFWMPLGSAHCWGQKLYSPLFPLICRTLQDRAQNLPYV